MVRTRALPDVEMLRVRLVRHAGDHRLRLRFSDGVTGIADLSGYLRRPMFRSLREERRFARARLANHYTVVWPGDIDIAPEALYALTVPDGTARKRDLLRSHGDAAVEYAAQCDRMPEISRFFGIIIRMFAEEHSPPHFHARYGRHTVTVSIRDGSIRTHGFPPGALSRVLEWRKLHRRELLANWDRMRRGDLPVRIPPLTR